VDAYWKIINNRKFKLTAQRVAGVAYERWSPARFSKYSDLTENINIFGILEKWSLMKGGNTGRFDFNTYQLKI